MANKTGTRKTKESKLVPAVGCSIEQEDRARLITPSGDFYFYKGHLMSAEPVADYQGKVNEEIDAIKRRASSGLFTDSYTIKFYGKVSGNVKLSW